MVSLNPISCWCAGIKMFDNTVLSEYCACSPELYYRKATETTRPAFYVHNIYPPD